MATLLIPTRNRPTSLEQVFGFLARFYPSTQILVADGSDEVYQVENRRRVDAAKSALSIDYRAYPPDLPLFDRLLDVLRGLPDEFVIMGSDDDFPMMDVLDEAGKFLRTNRDYVTGMGALLHLNLNSPIDLVVRLGLARPVDQATPLKRARDFAAWPFATTYAVTRRALLLERYERARNVFLAGFYDFAAGVQDCMHGKILAIPTLGFICTRNYNHSYLRPASGLFFLRKSAEILQIADEMRRDLIKYAGLEDAEAEKASEQLVRQRIAEYVGLRAHTRTDLKESPVYNNRIVQEQFRLFEMLFKAGSADREKYAERLSFISIALRQSAESGDNLSEPGTYETLEQQRTAEIASVIRRDDARRKTLELNETSATQQGDAACKPIRAGQPKESRRMAAVPRINRSGIPDMVIQVEPETMLRTEAL